MPFNADYFSRALKVERAKNGWSQDDLSGASGLSKNAIARYESGENKPSFQAACKLADALGCSTDDFWVRDRKAS